MTAPDWAAEGLLDGLEGTARDERGELLDWMVTQRGFDVADLRDQPSEILPFLAAERVVMQGPPSLSARQLGRRTGLGVERHLALRQVQGLPAIDPDEVRFSEAEAQAADIAGRFAALGVDDDQMAAVIRVLGRGLAQTSQAMRALVLELILEPGATEQQLAGRYAVATEAVLPHVAPMMDALMRQHLRNMLDSEAIDVTERQSGRMPGARRVTIAFADLVGFTRLGEEIDPHEIGQVAARLEELAVRAAHGEVRMVKTIGDAAMFAAPRPEEMVAAALDLVDLVDAEGDSFPQVRVGIADGFAIQRGGDWFGRPVNLASRITTMARAGSVLVTEDAAGRVGFDWSFAGERKVRSIATPVKLFRARRAQVGV